MAMVTITNIPPFDGEHPLDLTYFNMGELRRLKEIGGIRPVSLTEALIEEDAEVMVAMAVIALERAGHKVPWLEPFWQAKRSRDVQDILIDFERGPGVPDLVPPTESAPPNANGTGESAKSSSSGERGRTDGEPSPENDPSPIGSPGSETTAE